jgi:hypothetical protein
MPVARHVEIFGRSFERSRTLAAALFGGALVFMVVGVIVEGPIGTILAAVGSTLATTALVSFLYDPFLKEILAQEIFERVGLRDSIVRAGLEDIDSGTEIKLMTSLTGSRRIVAAPLDPIAWAKERYPQVLGVVTGAATEVVVVLPSPDPCPARVLLARRLGTGENELARKLKELPDQIAEAWDKTTPASGSTLSVLVHEELVSSGLLLCDACAVIETGPAVRESATDRISMAHRFQIASRYGGWIREQLNEMVDCATLAAVRPITPSAQLPGRRAATGRSSTAVRDTRSAQAVQVPTEEAPDTNVAPAEGSALPALGGLEIDGPFGNRSVGGAAGGAGAPSADGEGNDDGA